MNVRHQNLRSVQIVHLNFNLARRGQALAFDAQIRWNQIGQHLDFLEHVVVRQQVDVLLVFGCDDRLQIVLQYFDLVGLLLQSFLGISLVHGVSTLRC